MNVSLTIEPPFVELLRTAGLDQFEKVMALPEKDVMRSVPGRMTTRLEIGGRVFFLKRFRQTRAAGQALNEWNRLCELHAAGIACPTPVAFGQRRSFLHIKESFLITASIPDAIQADWWIRDHPGRKQELMGPIAALARQFHAARYCHKDFYLCHFFVQENGGLKIYLIDLQRCERPFCCQRRWLIKDLAALHYSMTAQAGFTAEEWREFLKLYGSEDLRLMKAIEAKSARIAQHVPKHG